MPNGLTFGIAYGMGGFALSQNTGMSMAEAGDFIKRYFDRFPAVQNWLSHTKLVAAEQLAEEPRAKLFGAPRGRPTGTSAYFSRPMPLATWSAKTEVTHRVQYAVFASHFRRVVRLDLSLTEAMCAAFETTRRACRDYPKPVSFDRCFEVAALLDGIWGLTEKKLELLQCASCSSHYLVSKADSHPSGCPFCMLIRRHRILLPALAA